MFKKSIAVYRDTQTKLKNALFVEFNTRTYTYKDAFKIKLESTLLSDYKIVQNTVKLRFVTLLM
jgi:hypothetical protein